MYLAKEGFDRGRGEAPKLSKSSKGYPERRDPQAENPKGIMSADLSQGSTHRLRQKYGRTRHY